MMGQAMADTGLVTTNARPDIFTPVRRYFVGKFRISNQGAYHADHVCFAFAQYL